MKLNEETLKGTFFRNIRKDIGSYYFRGFSLEKHFKKIPVSAEFFKSP